VPDCMQPADVQHVQDPVRNLRNVPNLPDAMRRYVRQHLCDVPGRHLQSLYACHLRQ